MKKALIALSMTVMAPGANAGSLTEAFFIDDVRESMPPMVMPHLEPMKTEFPLIQDSDPRSRHMLVDYITNHDGFEWITPDLGNRQHVMFSFGEAKLDDKQTEKVKEFASGLGEGDKVMVLSFTDRTGSVETNMELAEQRAQALIRELEKAVSAEDIIVISSTHWPGDPAKARRAEAIVVRK